MPSKVQLQVELVEKNAEARLRALDKLAKEMANRKITMQFDEGSLAKWKSATEGMTNAQLSNYVKLAIGAENAAAKVVAADVKANQKLIAEEQKTNAKIIAERQKSFDKKVQLYEKEDTKRKAITEKTVQTQINAEAKVQAAAIKGANATKTQTSAQKHLNTEAEKTSGIFDGLTQRFTAANLISTLITTAISKLKQAIREANEELKEMSKELTTIKMVTGASDSYINNLTSQAFAGASANGRNVTDYLTAAERFARAGYRDDIDSLSKLSLLTQNIGGVEEETAAKFLLAADAAWKLGGSYDSLMEVLDGVSAVADQNATDLSKIAEGITVAGSAFANAGESAATFTAMLGVTTASTQRSGSEMARGLRMILFRVRQVKAEFEDGEIVDEKAISNAANALKNVADIDVIDEQTKDLKSLSQILEELAPKWASLSKAEQSYLQNYLAGNRNGNVLYALMDNWGTYKQMLSEYENASGTALEKNAIYTESWEAKTNELKTAWTETMSIMTNSGEVQKNIVSWTAQALANINEFLRKQKEANPNYDRYAGARYLLGQSGANINFGGGGSGHSFTLEGEEDAYRRAQSAAEKYQAQGIKLTNALKENEGALVDHSEAVETDVEAVDELADSFKNAESAIKAASEAMKTDEDDMVKSAADIFKAMSNAAEKGYYGSNAYKEGASLFFGTSDKSKIKQEAQDALAAYFEGISEGKYANAAAQLFQDLSGGSGVITDAAGNAIAAIEDLGDSYKYAFDMGDQGVDSFLQSMQDATGISTSFWASLIQSLGMYSDELDDWMKKSAEEAGGGEGEENKIEYEVTANTNPAVKAIEEVNGLLGSIKDKVVTIYIDYRPGSPSGTQYDRNTNRNYASGKRDSYSGIAMVNDESPANGTKPELIISKSRGMAFIANGGRPALVNLRSDDIVLTASQTRSAIGVPSFAGGKRTARQEEFAGFWDSLLGDNSTSESTASSELTAPKDEEEEESGSGSGGKKKKNAKKSWESLKPLVEYLLEKAQKDLKDQLKVLDKQLEELEAQRKAQKDANELEEKQLAVENALVDLQKAQTERTVRYYNEETQQWEWMADQGSVEKAQEAYDKAQKDLADYLDEKEYERQKEAIQDQKDELQEQYDQMKEAWEDIVDAIEAPSGDIKQLLEDIIKNGSGTLLEQSGSIADLLNALRDSIFDAGYDLGIGRINDNTPGSGTTTETVFDSGGFARGRGFMRKGAGTETVIGPEITKDILNPIKNERFNSFVDSLRYLVDGQSPVFRNPASITNNNGGNFYVNGVRVGEDMAQRPFAEVMRTIAIHANETA